MATENHTVNEGHTVNEVARLATERLTPRYGAGEAKAMTRIIFEQLKGWAPVDLVIRGNDELSDFIASKVSDTVDRLLANEPIQYIFGVADFYGMKLKVTPDTLIPRQETAELVDIIVKENTRKDLRVIDLGTGSGCIAIALSRNLPFAEVTAVDFSQGALAVAQQNAKDLRCKINFTQADILALPNGATAPLSGPFDIIVSNPPYIADHERTDMEANVLDFEPSTALFVPDTDPLRFYIAELDYATEALTTNGRIYFEINPLYANELKAIALQKGFRDATLIRDTFGKQRFLSATKQ
jgi:release factor glutamine methyltransferase